MRQADDRLMASEPEVMAMDCGEETMVNIRHRRLAGTIPDCSFFDFFCVPKR
jgi:hypothetical protein